MIKDFKIYKKNFTVATMILVAVAMTGCAKKETQIVQQEQSIEQDQNQDGKTYYSTYDEEQQEFIWEEVPEEERPGCGRRRRRQDAQQDQGAHHRCG